MTFNIASPGDSNWELTESYFDLLRKMIVNSPNEERTFMHTRGPAGHGRIEVS